MTAKERINKYGRYPLRVDLSRKALEARAWIQKRTGLRMYQIDSDAYIIWYHILKDKYKKLRRTKHVKK